MKYQNFFGNIHINFSQLSPKSDADRFLYLYHVKKPLKHAVLIKQFMLY